MLPLKVMTNLEIRVYSITKQGQPKIMLPNIHTNHTPAHTHSQLKQHITPRHTTLFTVLNYNATRNSPTIYVHTNDNKANNDSNNTTYPTHTPTTHPHIHAHERGNLYSLDTTFLISSSGIQFYTSLSPLHIACATLLAWTGWLALPHDPCVFSPLHMNHSEHSVIATVLYRCSRL